ncbi:MFS transporter [Kordiimonas aquimaris]|uniref:MFS transporter n=1 Tax=Kordiimonas aquimaris TaxID=707591 RepID=UPI0021D27678|nr:MFS transporter [Kordiimonas aquimaris]
MNVFLLMASQACFLAYSLTMITFAGLSGKLIAADPALATLPISLSLITTALATGPISLLMQKYGRKRVFLTGATSGVAGGAIAAFGLYIGSFPLFCFASLFIGSFQASAQYYRFAAGESVDTPKAPRAISLVLAGGLFAAVLTPVGNGFFNTLLAPHTFVGAFIFTAFVATLALLPLLFLKPIGHGVNVGTDAKDNNDGPEGEEAQRPMTQIIKQPAFLVAAINGALGYAMMTFVMTATPLAMQICGFTAGVSANVITAHAMAMFFPSFFTGSLITRFGILPILLLGQSMFAVAFMTALSGITIGDFSIALIALGLGWNFCFIGGTTLLTRVHRASEKGRVQGLNEMLVFGSSAASSLAAGIILRYFGWQIVNQAAFVMLVIAATVTILWAVRGRQGEFSIST